MQATSVAHDKHNTLRNEGVFGVLQWYILSTSIPLDNGIAVWYSMSVSN